MRKQKSKKKAKSSQQLFHNRKLQNKQNNPNQPSKKSHLEHKALLTGKWRNNTASNTMDPSQHDLVTGA
jgi:hypothetical protein